jgi:putative peptidoglycan lipid II flippase
VVQISAYVDSLLASFLPTGAVAALSYAQTLYSLPVSLFGMAVSAAELPAMSSAMGSDEEIATTLRSRLENGLRQIAYFVVPSAVAFLILGNVVVATIYQSGVFTERDVRYVWTVLAGATVGLLASTSGRLYSSAFYALRDTRTPLRFAIARVSLGLMLGYLFALRAPGWLNFDRSWGVAGLTLASGIAGWVEFVLLRRALRTRIGAVGSQLGYVLKLWAIALVAAAVAFGIEHVVRVGHPVIRGIVVLGAYGLIYIAVTSALGIAGPLNRLRGRRA